MDLDDVGPSEGLLHRHEPHEPAVDIVILHGFNSSIERAFTHANGRNWACDSSFWGRLADKIRLMTFSYNANAFHDVINARVIDHAEKLLEQLYYARRASKERPLIFIAHSMGGLVVKRALIQAKQIDRYESILSSTASTIFLATPHFGADRTGQVAMLQRLVAWSKLRSSNHIKNSQELAMFSDTINDINRSFKPPNIEIVNFYEQRETRLPSGSAMIVEPGSAILPFPNERHIPSPSTHESICKFDGPKDTRFISLWEQVDLIVENALASLPLEKTSINDDLISDIAPANSAASTLQAPDSLATSRRVTTFNSLVDELSMKLGHEQTFVLHRQPTLDQKFKTRLESATDENFVSGWNASDLPMPDKKGLLNAQKEDRVIQDKFLSRLRSWKSYRQKEEKLSRHHGTCQWVFAHPTFKKWHHPNDPDVSNAILFLAGPSGCGKSVLANHIANTLANNSASAETASLANHPQEEEQPEQARSTRTQDLSPTVLRFFCTDARYRATYSDSAKEEYAQRASLSTPIIEYFLYQLLDTKRHLFYSVPEISARLNDVPAPRDIQAMFKMLIASGKLGHIILIIDGLDECDDTFNQDLLAYLDSLVREASNDTSHSLRVLISCQPVGFIPIWSRQYLCIAVKLEDVSQDINKYIQDELAIIARTRSFGKDLEELAMMTLSESAGRSFLWTSFILRELRQMPVVSPAAVKAATTSFPRDLDRYYANFLANLAQETQATSNQESSSGWIFLAVWLSSRDLSAPELAELLAISEDRQSFEDIAAHVNTDVGTLVERRLSPLLVIENDRIVIAHSSISEYVDKIASVCLPLGKHNVPLHSKSTYGHMLMAERCLRYLLLRELEKLAHEPYLNWTKIKAKYRLLDFACWSLATHLKGAGQDVEKLLPLLRRFFKDDSGGFKLYLRYLNPKNERQLKGAIGPVLCQLVHLDLQSVFQSLTGLDGIMNSASTSRILPKNLVDLIHRLKWELRLRSHDAEDGLCSIDKRDPWGRTPVHYAARSKNTAWLRVFSTLNADMFAKTAIGETALHMAVKKNNGNACLEWLLEKGLQIDELDMDQYSALATAVSVNNFDAVKLLLEHDANVNPEVRTSQLPLHLAVDGAHEDIALLLLQHKPHLHNTDEVGASILHAAARTGMVRFARALLELEPDFSLDARSQMGYRPLQLAAMLGRSEFVEMLLDLGVDPNVEISYDWSQLQSDLIPEGAHETALFLAIEGGHIPAALQLLKGGAQQVSLVKASWYPVLYAIRNDHFDLLKALCDAIQRPLPLALVDPYGYSSLHWAAVSGNQKFVEYILSFKVPIDSPDVWGETPMMNAIRYGHRELVDILLRAGADCKAVSEFGYTTLCLAARGRYPNIIDLLLPYGPDLQHKTLSGATALYFAVKNEDVLSVKLLLDAGASLGFMDDEYAPVHAAARHDNCEILNLLLQAGADVKARTWYGATPLMLALSDEHTCVTDMLIRGGGWTANMQDNDGQNPYHWAVASGLVSQLEKVWALDGGAMIDVPSTAGMTPFCVACRNASVDIVRWLIDKRADIHKIDPNNLSTGLHTAAVGGSPEIARLLLDCGFLLEKRDSYGDSALDIACRHGHSDIVRLMIEKGADLNDYHELTGETCLHISARNGHVDCVKLLLQAGSKIDSLDHRSFTPLLASIIANQKKVTQLLIASGAEVDMSDIHGKSAYKLIQVIHHSPSPEERCQALKDASRENLILLVKRHLGENCDTSKTKEHMSEIAECLLHLDDDINATRAYLHRLHVPQADARSKSVVTKQTPIRHMAHCDACEKPGGIVGARFKCLTCDDIDLCSHCMTYYKNSSMRVISSSDQTKIVCEGHKYFEIPGTFDKYAMMTYEREQYRRDTSAWLQGVLDKYAGSTEKSSELNLEEAKIEPQPSISLWLHPQLAMPVFQVQMMWHWRLAPFRKLSVSVPTSGNGEDDPLD